MNNGYLCIVLHAHLPYVHHPEYAYFHEENWLFQAITECYVPLIIMLDRLQADGVDFRLSMSLSPTLISQWRNPLLQQRYIERLQQQAQLAENQRTRAAKPELRELADWHYAAFRRALYYYRDYYLTDLLGALVRHQRSGKLELFTTAATHAYLPLLNRHPNAVRMQLRAGLDYFTDATGIAPRGFWLPECGYYPGLEELTREYGIDYFFLESHALLDTVPTPAAGVYRPIICPNGTAAFARDPASSRQVWSANEGYPGHPAYREYHCDIGYSLPPERLLPLPADAAGAPTGIKYYRVGEKNGPKQYYAPEAAWRQAREHAAHFMEQRCNQVRDLSGALGVAPIIVAPYDAELFGHWWFEGPVWLEQVLRLAAESPDLRCAHAGEYLALNRELPRAQPCASSWGEQGYSEFWLNESNAWIYPLLYKAQTEWESLLADLRLMRLAPLQERALNQALRSLLLAQASDWPFILKTGGHAQYARERIYDYLSRFNYLLDTLRKNQLDEYYLAGLEIMDDIFPNLDFRRYPPPPEQNSA